MSRSYKQAFFQLAADKRMKTLANRHVRRNADIPNGKAYKKLFSSYDICDSPYDMRFAKIPYGKKMFKEKAGRKHVWHSWK